MVCTKPLLDSQLSDLSQEVREERKIFKGGGSLAVQRMGEGSRMDLRKLNRAHSSAPLLDDLGARYEITQSPPLRVRQDHHRVESNECHECSRGETAGERENRNNEKDEVIAVPEKGLSVGGRATRLVVDDSHMAYSLGDAVESSVKVAQNNQGNEKQEQEAQKAKTRRFQACDKPGKGGVDEEFDPRAKKPAYCVGFRQKAGANLDEWLAGLDTVGIRAASVSR
jgi:hypothetical protein